MSLCLSSVCPIPLSSCVQWCGGRMSATSAGYTSTSYIMSDTNNDGASGTGSGSSNNNNGGSETFPITSSSDGRSITQSSSSNSHHDHDHHDTTKRPRDVATNGSSL